MSRKLNHIYRTSLFYFSLEESDRGEKRHLVQSRHTPTDFESLLFQNRKINTGSSIRLLKYFYFCDFKIRIGTLIYVDELLRIPIKERKPAALHLNH
jgi:hypothetical protein